MHVIGKIWISDARGLRPLGLIAVKYSHYISLTAHVASAQVLGSCQYQGFVFVFLRSFSARVSFVLYKTK